MKYKSLVPQNRKVEGWLSQSQTSMRFDLLQLYNTGNAAPIKSKLTHAQKELFAGFYQEQQRLNRIAEIQYLKRYLREQRNKINQIAAFLKKRDTQEIKTYGRVPIFGDTKSYYLGAPAGKFKITNNLNDLRAKVDILDKLLRDGRDFVMKYESKDFDRKDMLKGGGMWNRMLTVAKKARLKKSA